MMLIFLSYKKISHYYIPIFSFCFATSIVKVFKSLSRSWFYHLGTTIKLFLHFGLSLSIVTRCFCFFEPNVTRSSNSISPCFHLIGDPLYHAYVCFSFYFFSYHNSSMLPSSFWLHSFLGHALMNLSSSNAANALIYVTYLYQNLWFAPFLCTFGLEVFIFPESWQKCSCT